MPFLKEEKSEHERARKYELARRLNCARHCELPLSKMGSKGLFPGVAVPLAFFCTLFFRHRKKSVSAPWDGKSQSAPESARQAPPGQGFAPAGALVAFRSPPVPFGSPPEAIERSIGLQAPPPAPQSARQALGGNLFTAKLAFATACPNETNAAGNKTGTIFYHPQSLPF